MVNIRTHQEIQDEGGLWFVVSRPPTAVSPQPRGPTAPEHSTQEWQISARTQNCEGTTVTTPTGWMHRPQPDNTHTKEGIEQHVRTEVGGIEWVRMQAGNGVMSLAQLAEYVEKVRHYLGPHAVVFLSEYELRAYVKQGDDNGPRVLWD